jgi:NADH:ubiquinone oxidoreductase subunit 6 (subunit J)
MYLNILYFKCKVIIQLLILHFLNFSSSWCSISIPVITHTTVAIWTVYIMKILYFKISVERDSVGTFTKQKHIDWNSIVNFLMSGLFNIVIFWWISVSNHNKKHVKNASRIVKCYFSPEANFSLPPREHVVLSHFLEW